MKLDEATVILIALKIDSRNDGRIIELPDSIDPKDFWEAIDIMIHARVVLLKKMEAVLCRAENMPAPNLEMVAAKSAVITTIRNVINVINEL